MDLLGSFVIACSMYSRVPMPHVEWTAKRMKYALCFFPAVGVMIGAVLLPVLWLAGRLNLGVLATGCIGTVLPVGITGGIHLDGFLDVVDARSSGQSRERKLEIMKDPHSGAFAVIYGGVYLLLYLAAFSELQAGAFPSVAGIYVLVRALSAWSVVSFPKARKDGLATSFSEQAQTRVVQASAIFWAVAATGYMMITGGVLYGGCMLAAATKILIGYRRRAVREFGGITGDIAGYFLQICELCLLALAAIWFRILM